MPTSDTISYWWTVYLSHNASLLSCTCLCNSSKCYLSSFVCPSLFTVLILPCLTCTIMKRWMFFKRIPFLINMGWVFFKVGLLLKEYNIFWSITWSSEIQYFTTWTEVRPSYIFRIDVCWGERVRNELMERKAGVWTWIGSMHGNLNLTTIQTQLEPKTFYH